VFWHFVCVLIGSEYVATAPKSSEHEHKHTRLQQPNSLKNGSKHLHRTPATTQGNTNNTMLHIRNKTTISDLRSHFLSVCQGADQTTRHMGCPVAIPFQNKTDAHPKNTCGQDSSLQPARPPKYAPARNYGDTSNVSWETRRSAARCSIYSRREERREERRLAARSKARWAVKRAYSWASRRTFSRC